MMPCNYIDLLTLDEQNSRILAGQKSHLGPHPKESSHEGYPAPSREQQPCQIQVNSTIDADIVLRRVIEDRAAILALTSRAATNEAELMKAKTRQLHITKILDRQDQEIAKLTTKAKCELVEYNEKCKQYIRSFMFAFEKGDMDKLPRHPFVPPLEELERAIDRRKATFIEKVQADDRVKKLEFINSQERVTMEVLKKNEEAFLRAIEIAKEKFSDRCGTWRNRVNKLLSNMPHHAQKFSNLNYTMEAWRPQVQAPEKPFRCLPPEKYDGTPQYNRQIFAQDLKQPPDKEFMSPEMSMKRPVVHVSPEGYAKSPIVHISPERHAKSPIGNFRPMCSGFPRETEYAPRPGLVRAESPGNKRQKMERQSTPPLSPVMSSANGARIVDLCNGDQDIPDQQIDESAFSQRIHTKLVKAAARAAAGYTHPELDANRSVCRRTA